MSTLYTNMFVTTMFVRSSVQPQSRGKSGAQMVPPAVVRRHQKGPVERQPANQLDPLPQSDTRVGQIAQHRGILVVDPHQTSDMTRRQGGEAPCVDRWKA